MMSSNRLASSIATALGCFAVTMVATEKIYAVPASPRIHILTQADGSTIKARQWGDEWLHGVETVDGYTIVFDEATQNWMYATHDTEGKLVSSTNVVGKNLPPKKGRNLRPIKQAANKIASIASKEKAFSPEGKPLLKTISPTGLGEIPVIMINFRNGTTTETTTHNLVDFDNLLFNGTGGHTMRDYYNEVSYGAFTVDGDLDGWYVAANNRIHYGAKTATEVDDLPGLLVEEAVMAADPTFNFTPFDTDNDCYVDVVAIIHQGEGEENSLDTDDIWSHHWSLSASNFWGAGSAGEYTTNDPCITGTGNVIVNDYIIQPEILDTDMHTMGIFAHEYGHALGLPDLYDTDDTSEGIGDWGLMASGSWKKGTSPGSLPGDLPGHMSAWSKYFLGWVTPTKVTDSLPSEEIEAAATAADVYQFGDGTPSHPAPTGGEYFLIENRQQTGFDAGLPGAGLAIWHIDEAKENNTEFCYPSTPPSSTDCSATHHYKVALEQADGLWELEKKNDRGDAGDVYADFPSGFTDSTTPNSYLYDGKESGVTITNIGVPDPTTGTIIADLAIHFTKDIPWGWQWHGMNGTHDLALGDYDGDGATDRAIILKSTSQWWVIASSTGDAPSDITWGGEWPEMKKAHEDGHDIELALGDYDGDGKTDRAIVVHRTGADSRWYILSSSTGAQGVPNIPWGWEWPDMRSTHVIEASKEATIIEETKVRKLKEKIKDLRTQNRRLLKEKRKLTDNRHYTD